MDVKDILIRLVIDWLADHEQASEDIKRYIADHTTDNEYADIAAYLRDAYDITLSYGDFDGCDFVVDDDDYLECDFVVDDDDYLEDEDGLHIDKEITGNLDDYFGEFFTIGFPDKSTLCDVAVIRDYQLVDATEDYYIFQ